ncbi:type VII secretion protein EssB [Numidum massiliense]|uniref:type VII secretion protein EssB n=1 Tax=Numidum massiliense TaxID=1522315 RepID=UPI00093B05D4|nr:type VII secretion protein EssB [Numidum massiliense]
MSEQQPTYLEQQLEARIGKENGYTFAFQKEKIKLDDRLEIDLLKEMTPCLHKEIVETDDELIVIVHPPSNFEAFDAICTKNRQSRWRFAHQLVKKVREHSLSRLHLIVCPETIVFDKSMEPYFLHYGVKESIPPYEKDGERLQHEVKAAVAAAIDEKYTFDEYLNFHKTSKLSETTKRIMTAKDLEELQALIEEQIDQLEAKDKTLVHIPQKKWKRNRYISIGLLVCLLPALIYTGYAIFFQQPKHDAFLDSSKYFLNNEYSEVVNTLERYKIDEMPPVVQYGLATSYAVSVSMTLDAEQRKNIRDMVTLQSDPQYYAYWIHLGRGENEEAIDVARSLEEQDLLVYALVKYSEEVKADGDLSGEEKQKKLEGIQKEIDEYHKEQEEQERKEQEEKKQQEEKRKQQEEQRRKQEEQRKKEEKEKKGEQKGSDGKKADSEAKKESGEDKEKKE